jgi:serine/threonine-protein kinase
MHDKANNAQLQNEIRGLSKARSRHVVEIYDVLQDENSDITGIIIERLRGRDFSTFHEQAASNPHDFLKVLYQVATALKDIHAVGIIHRDLKLDNFKESSSGVVKLFDFGISSPGGGYQTKENKGTLVYAAPELYVAGATITPEMDIYAFGACAWALASPKFPPVLKEMPPQQSAACPSISAVMPTYPSHADDLHAEVVTLIDACLNPNPKARPTAETLSSVLGRHLVRNRHRGLFIQGKFKVVELSAGQPPVNLKIDGLGEITVVYDGLIFLVKQVSGSVRINNVPVAAGDVLHQACLLSFGDSSLGSGQQWVTFFASHPEVVL